MGSWFSSEETVTVENPIDSTGHVNNNIIIQEAKDTHSQALLSERLLVATYILIALEILKLVLCSYNTWRRHLKRKYIHSKPSI